MLKDYAHRRMCLYDKKMTASFSATHNLARVCRK